MNLDAWLAKHNMESGQLARIIGVSRQVIWKIKQGMTVDTETAQKVYFITGGCVNPISKPKGRPRVRVKKD